ncbi:hypothetical protein BC831DRAFT_464559 [Entophlyctis helioformis]|nr:hypothetical protein BC831DRAFT_464559 [Entophlyctis helioformis]
MASTSASTATAAAAAAAAFRQHMSDEIAAAVAASPRSDRIIDLLTGLSCCYRCVLRFVGIRQSRLHEAMPVWTIPSGAPASPTATATAAAAATTHTLPHHTCPACLGLLQLNHAAMAQAAWTQFQAKPYMLADQTFGVSCRLPPQLSIRHRSLLLFLEKNLPPVEKRAADPVTTPVAAAAVASEPQRTNGKLDKIAYAKASRERYNPPNGPIEVKDVFKHLVSNAFARVSGMAADTQSPLSVVFHLTHPASEMEFEFLTKIPAAKFTVKTSRAKGIVVHRGAAGEKIAKAVTLVGYDDFAAHGMVPPKVLEAYPQVTEVGFEHSQIFVAGRYCKHRRGISNSPWEIGGKRLAEHSVEELIGTHLDRFFDCSGHKFSSAGREDADVLMLGRGRPFYFEVTNPHRAVASDADMASLEATVNAAAKGWCPSAISRLFPESTMIMKDSASTKSKSYRCLVEFSAPVEQAKLDELAARTDIPVEQRNPTRVPRRADLVRSKCIETIRFVPRELAPLSATDAGATGMGVKVVDVFMRTSAGTYVKEFVHGDDGRTEPCLKSLFGLEAARVIELDVSEIHLDWPAATGRDGSAPVLDGFLAQ